MYKRQGICRKEGSTNLRTFKTDNVIKSNYLLSLPEIVEGILAGDLIDVTDRQATFTQCMVTDSYAGNLEMCIRDRMADVVYAPD